MHLPTVPIAAIPYINTGLLALLVVIMAAVVYRRHHAANDAGRQNREILIMLKVLVAELRPCVTAEVEYRSDKPVKATVRPPSSGRRPA